MTGVIRFTAIRAPQFDDNAFRLRMVSAIREFSEETIKEFEETTSYWKSGRPKFTYKMSTGKGHDISTEILYDNPVYGYIDKDVPGHVLKEVRVGKTFGSGSMPGTLTVQQVPARDSKSVLTIKEGTWWPGIAARHFGQQILDSLESSGVTLGSFLQAFISNRVYSNKWWIK